MQGQVKEMLSSKTTDAIKEHAPGIAGAVITNQVAGGAEKLAAKFGAEKIAQYGVLRSAASVVSGGALTMLEVNKIIWGDVYEQATGKVDSSGALIANAASGLVSVVTGEDYMTGQKNEGSLLGRLSNVGVKMAKVYESNKIQVAAAEAKEAK